MEAYQKPWDIPWGAKTVVGGMTLWATSFIIVGIVLLPLIGYTFGIEVSLDPQLHIFNQNELNLFPSQLVLRSGVGGGRDEVRNLSVICEIGKIKCTCVQ